MLRPPPLKFVPYYPITAGVSAAAIVVTGLWWSGQNIDAFTMNTDVWSRWQLWRALTATLPHVNFFHLAFNLYWVWTFGTLVERVYGHLKCAGIFLLLAFGSSLADFALSSGGVGLSGVGYGLWGLLMVLEQRDARFADAVDRQTNQLFIFWFFLCIVLTIINVMPVANVAHGAGAVLGILLGLAVAGKRSVRWPSRAGLTALMILILLGATVFWPKANFSSDAEAQVEHDGLEALDRGDVPHAVKLLEVSAHMRNAPARAWYNLGVACLQADRYSDALAAFKHAAQMPDADSQMRRALQDMESHSTETGTNQ